MTALAAAAPAGAATVDVRAVGTGHDFTLLRYRAAPGEANAVTVTRSGRSVLVADAGAPIAPGRGCRAVSAHAVRCGLALLGSFALRDRSDTFVNRTRMRVQADGGTGDDRLAGGPGEDDFSGGPGADDVRGGRGDRDTFTTLDRPGDPRPASVTLDGRANDGHRGEHDNVHTDVEVLGGGRGDDVLVGDARANILIGGGGTDRLRGRGGDDELEGSGRLEGGAGDDRMTTDSAVKQIDTVVCGPGDDEVGAGFEDVVAPGCEHVGFVAAGWPMGGTAPPTADPVAAVDRAGRTAVVRLQCPPAATLGCFGRLVLAESAAPGGPVLGRAVFDLPAHRAMPVTVRLTSAGRRLMRQTPAAAAQLLVMTPVGRAASALELQRPA